MRQPLAGGPLTLATRFPTCSSLEDMAGESSFVCERVCTSDRLLRRLGKLAKVRQLSNNSCCAC